MACPRKRRDGGSEWGAGGVDRRGHGTGRGWWGCPAAQRTPASTAAARPCDRLRGGGCGRSAPALRSSPGGRGPAGACRPALSFPRSPGTIEPVPFVGNALQARVSSSSLTRSAPSDTLGLPASRCEPPGRARARRRGSLWAGSGLRPIARRSVLFMPRVPWPHCRQERRQARIERAGASAPAAGRSASCPTSCAQARARALKSQVVIGLPRNPVSVRPDALAAKHSQSGYPSKLGPLWVWASAGTEPGRARAGAR